MTDTPHRRDNPQPPEFQAELATCVRDTLVDLHGLAEDDAARIAREVAARFAEDHPGTQFYIAKGYAAQLDERDLALYRDFNGRNYGELAKRLRMHGAFLNENARPRRTER